MSRYYSIPNKVNLPLLPHSIDIDPGYNCKSKPSIIIESEKKSSWPIKNRQLTISLSKENTPPRRTYHKLQKQWQTVAKTTVSKPGSHRSLVFLLIHVAMECLDPRLMFNFIDVNADSRVSYLEFRSWMLIIDQTLAEHELFQIFNEIDRNGTSIKLHFSNSSLYNPSRPWFYSV